MADEPKPKGKPRGRKGGAKPIGAETRSVLFQRRVTPAEVEVLDAKLAELRVATATQ